MNNVFFLTKIARYFLNSTRINGSDLKCMLVESKKNSEFYVIS